MNIVKNAFFLAGFFALCIYSDGVSQTLSDLEPLLSRLSAEEPDSVQKKADKQTSFFTLDGRALYIQTPGLWGISDMGLIPHKVITDHPSLSAFLNRLALASLILDKTRIISYLESENGKVIIGSDHVNVFSQPVSVRSEGKTWQVRFESGYSIQIPKSLTLISGLQKEQLDNYLSRLLRQKSAIVNPVGIPLGNTPSPMPGFSQTVYRSENDFVWSSDRLRESLMNLIFAIPEKGSEITFSVTHQSYGRTKAGYLVPFSGLYNGMLKEGDNWLGTEEIDPDTIQVTILSFDKDFDHAHLVTFTAGRQVISEKNPVLDARLFTYIRQENVLNWLKDQHTGHSSERFEVNR